MIIFQRCSNALREQVELDRDRKDLNEEVLSKEKQIEKSKYYNKKEKRFNTLQHILCSRELDHLKKDHEKVKFST